MALRISLDVAGVHQINRALLLSAAAVKDLRPVWEDLYDDFLQGERSLFAAEGNVGSRTREMESSGAWGLWEPLNEDYAKRKQAQGYGTKILVRTGRLKESLTERSHADAVFQSRELGMSLGTKVPYAGYHQTGTSRMPAREPIRINESKARRWMRLIQQFILESGQFVRGGE